MATAGQNYLLMMNISTPSPGCKKTRPAWQHGADLNEGSSPLASDGWAWFVVGVNNVRPRVRAWVLLVPLAVVTAASLQAGPASLELVIQDGGQRRPFELALDELWLDGTNAPVWRFAPLSGIDALRTLANTRQRAQTNNVSLVLHEVGAARNEFTRRLLTRDVLVRLDPSANWERVAAGAGVAALRRLPLAAGWAIAHAGELDGALALAVALRRQAGVLSAEPQLRRWHEKKLVPNDPWFSSQWHLHNVGQSGGVPGVDINVVSVWDAWRGSGVAIGVVDDGVQAAHSDLAPNLDASLSMNFNASTFDPTWDTHGTPVAGLIGARGNNGIGVAGVAFESRLADLRLIAEAETDEQDAAAMLHRNDVLAVKNNSWGAYDGDGRLEGPGPLMTDALVQGTTSGRSGKGVVYAFAAGNGKTSGENANCDGFANSVRVIAVGAVNDQGTAASYSEPGSCVAVVAPSRGGSTTCSGRPGTTTTDLLGSAGRNPGGSCEPWDRDYTSTFGGTSAATPIVSGVAALLLQANPTLSWRDAKEILMRSATKVAATDADWRTNRAGVPHNHQYGAGLVNAGAAMLLATQWLSLEPMQILTLPAANLNLPVPDNNPTGVSVGFTVTNQGFRVEHAALVVTLPHPRYGDLAINLTSPWGTTSRLAELHSSTGAGYNGWTLTSVRQWGEPAAGTWTVNLADLAPANTGALQVLQLTLYGSMPAARLSAERVNGGFRVALHAAAIGWNYALETSTNLAQWSQVAVLNPGPDGSASFTDASPAVELRFYRARHVP